MSGQLPKSVWWRWCDLKSILSGIFFSIIFSFRKGNINTGGKRQLNYLGSNSISDNERREFIELQSELESICRDFIIKDRTPKDLKNLKSLLSESKN